MRFVVVVQHWLTPQQHLELEDSEVLQQFSCRFCRFIGNIPYLTYGADGFSVASVKPLPCEDLLEKACGTQSTPQMLLRYF